MNNIAPLNRQDLALLQEQMVGRRFDPNTALGVAKRCGWGAPQVILCRPLKDGLPFPTTFWLTCPWLVKRLGQFESHGGVKLMEEQLARVPGRWRAYQKGYAKTRRNLISKGQQKYLQRYFPALWRSLAQGGVGGIRSFVPTAKCLHLQTGAWLGLGYHPAGRWLKKELGSTECDCNLCSSCGK